MRDLVLSNTIPISLSPGTGRTGNFPSVNPILAADGRTVLFQSSGGNLVPNDFNGTRDFFAVRLGVGDTDGDGMDDDWEMTYFGNLTHDGSADTDGDGLSDLQEFRAGTNPTSNTSVLRCLAVTSSLGKATIWWSAIPGRSYRVEYKDSVGTPGWQLLVDVVVAQANVASVTDEEAPSSSQRFYRVSAWP